MKSAKMILILLGVCFATLAGFGVVTFYRDHPHAALGVAAVLGILVVMSLFSDRRIRRELAAAESALAGSACPACGQIFGREAAAAAIHPPRLPGVRYRIVDDRGYSTVTCPGCGSRSLFHRLTHELLLSPQTEPA